MSVPHEGRPPAGEAPEDGTGEDPEDPVFEDEPPGAVLFELAPRPGLVIWGAADAALVAALGVLALGLEAGALGAGRLPLGLLWASLPVSALIGALVTAFTRLNLPAAAGPSPITRWAIGLQLLALGGWACLAWGLGARF